jgi:DNA-binding MarR family transcriptional regulator
VKLSDTQLMILSAASQRPDHAAVLPANLKGSTAKKVVDELVKDGLLQELRAREEMPVWRRGDDRRPLALRITKAGLKAIAVDVPEQTAGEADSLNNAPGAGLVVQAARAKVPTKRQRPASKSTAKKKVHRA